MPSIFHYTKPYSRTFPFACILTPGKKWGKPPWQRAKSYGAMAKILHWLIILLLAAQYAVGSIMPHIGRGTQNEGWVNWHLSIGAAILLS